MSDREKFETTIRSTPTAELRAMFLVLGAHQRGDSDAVEKHRAEYHRERAKRVIDAPSFEAVGA